MQTEDKRRQIESWFVPEPKLRRELFIIVGPFIFWGIIFFIIGILNIGRSGSITIFFGGIGVTVGTIGVILGGFMYYAYTKAKARYEARPSTDQMTQWLQEDLELLKEKTFENMNLDEEDETIADSLILKGPIWWADSSELDEEEIWRGKTDGQEYLYSVWAITILHIANNSLVVYYCDYNWTRDRVTNETTREYFYQDIGTVGTENKVFRHRLLYKERDIVKQGCFSNIGCCGCLGSGCLVYLNPIFVIPLLTVAAVQVIKDAFGESFNFELPDFLELKREEDEYIEIEGKTFQIGMSSGQYPGFLIDSQQLKTWGAQEEMERAEKAVTAITRRLRDIKSSD